MSTADAVDVLGGLVGAAVAGDWVVVVWVVVAWVSVGVVSMGVGVGVVGLFRVFECFIFPVGFLLFTFWLLEILSRFFSLLYLAAGLGGSAEFGSRISRFSLSFFV